MNFESRGATAPRRRAARAAKRQGGGTASPQGQSGTTGGGLKGVSQKSVDHDMKSMLIRFFGCSYLKYMVLKC